MKTVAAFDFDKTMTDRDTIFPFIYYTVGYLGCVWHLLMLIPYGFLFLIGYCTRSCLKELFLTRCFQGRLKEEIEALGKSFTQKKIKKYLKPEAVRRLRWHQKQGHICILVSASLDLYLKSLSSELGFDHLLCTNLAMDKEGLLTGSLEGENCWGQEKVHRLQRLLGKKDYLLYAYGDSQGDWALLNYANYSFYREMPCL